MNPFGLTDEEVTQALELCASILKQCDELRKTLAEVPADIDGKA